MYEIRDDIPAPLGSGMQGHKGRPPIFPFATMKPGDSFLAPPDALFRSQNAVAKWKQRHPGWDYRTKMLPDGSIRIWRV